MGLDSPYDPAEAEPRLQAGWSAAGIYQFDPADPRPIFAIDTPPPTVSGELHLGHLYSYTQAEAMARFWRMQGLSLYYPFGFDDNGLPTERFVERRLGRRARDLGRAAFVQACLATSAEAEAQFEAFWQRLGFSVDWRLRYSTIAPESQKIAQWAFLDLFRKGRIDRRQQPNPWCHSCETAVAQAELDEIEREAAFYTLAFPIAGARPIPIATTRPELLPACVAVLVHPDDDRYADLIGRAATVPLFERRVPILADPTVEPAKGSGAVMCCTFGDSADVQWWRAHRLPLIPLLTRQGRLSEHGGLYAGLTLAEARARILADSEAHGYLLGRTAAPQTARVHERCGTPVEILETSQWFIRLLDRKDELLQAGRQIAWHPEHMRVRYEHWVQNLGWDWCISRQRFYGVPFPAWHCPQCGAITLADEAQLPVDPLTTAPPRPCACGNADLRPDEDVMDTWATSSLSPQIAAQLFADPALYRRLSPMQLRPQAHDIIRTWSFYTIARAYLHFGSIPWQTIMISGHALDPHGRKLSKSQGNAPITPMALIDRHGADAVRYWACSAGLGVDQPLDEQRMKQGRRLITKLWNAARLLTQSEKAEGKRQKAEGRRQTDLDTSESPDLNAESDGQIEADADLLSSPFSLSPSDAHAHGAQRCDETSAGLSAIGYRLSAMFTLDRWLLSALQGVIAAATARWRAYDYAGALELTERFFWGSFCDQYLELVKGRLYDGAPEGRAAVRATMRAALATILKLLAPVMPHITEAIYAELFPEAGSIHIAAWPEPDERMHDPAAEAAGAALVAVLGAARRYKSSRARSLGSPLDELRVACADPGLRALLAEAAIDLRAAARADALTWAETPEEGDESVAPGIWVGIS